MLAQRIARAMQPGRTHYYLATMIPHDAEDDARIARHRAERAGWGFETVECGTHILAALEKTDPAGVFLLDSVTALVLCDLLAQRFGTDYFIKEAGR